MSVSNWFLEDGHYKWRLPSAILTAIVAGYCIVGAIVGAGSGKEQRVRYLAADNKYYETRVTENPLPWPPFSEERIYITIPLKKSTGADASESYYPDFGGATATVFRGDKVKIYSSSDGKKPIGRDVLSQIVDEEVIAVVKGQAWSTKETVDGVINAEQAMLMARGDANLANSVLQPDAQLPPVRGVDDIAVPGGPTYKFKRVGSKYEWQLVPAPTSTPTPAPAR
jgi:hypothetical protein